MSSQKVSWWKFFDIRLSAGISKAAFLQLHRQVYGCDLDSEALAYKFLSTTKELDELTQSFESLRSHGAIKWCVACCDSFLLQIRVPSKCETGNIKAYFSGLYQTYGINV